MQRKPTPNTRGPNAAELRFRAWVKEHHCAGCGNHVPVICDHVEGATFKHRAETCLPPVLVGHWFLLPLCQYCDDMKTHRSNRYFRGMAGNTSSMWLSLIEDYPLIKEIPGDVISTIKAFDK